MYTGQRRLAKSIQRKVTTNYAVNNPQILQTLEDARRLAIIMKYELQRGNIDGFASLLNTQMQHAVLLDPSSTNTVMSAIMSACEPFIKGIAVCGAGGGGFLYGILKEGVTLSNLKEHMYPIFNGTKIELFSCEIFE